ncbi:MAG: hypothetical protein PHC88_11970 [Terrimicrobiaceae bacterium]|nr:hypothetical protein [Terrimicrobiaceae bacterium]
MTTDAPTLLVLSDAQKKRLFAALEREGRYYDPSERMLRLPFASPGYHTTIKDGFVHNTRESLAYALALLDGGEANAKQTAAGILDRILDLQDIDPQSRTYGIWSWYLEEPLARMSPPDWNWADFCGTTLLQIVLTHRSRLDPGLLERIDASILHAARSIERRDVGPAYTNIAIMGAFVTLVAAETYGVPDLLDYALRRIRRLDEYTDHHGGFSEYNSPTYTITALDDLGRFRRYARDAGALRVAERLYRLAWEEIAWHFHFPTRQWAGPHSRCYATFVQRRQPSFHGLIQRATDRRFHAGETEPDLFEHRNVHRCPPDLEACFLELTGPRTFRKTFLRTAPDVVGTTHLDPGFALGTVNYGDLWNQRRALLAYWGGPEVPACLHLRFLHDGYDFSAAQFFSVQHEGTVLGAINFAVDGGDTHICLDMIKDGAIRAHDLRVRFEFGGVGTEFPLPAPDRLDELVRIHHGGIHLALRVPFATFGDLPGYWETGRDEDRAWLDIVLFSGEDRTIRFGDLATAAVGFVLQLSTDASPDPPLCMDVGEDCLALASEPSLRLGVSRGPDTLALLRARYSGTVGAPVGNSSA